MFAREGSSPTVVFHVRLIGDPDGTLQACKYRAVFILTTLLPFIVFSLIYNFKNWIRFIDRSATHQILFNLIAFKIQSSSIQPICFR